MKKLHIVILTALVAAFSARAAGPAEEPDEIEF